MIERNFVSVFKSWEDVVAQWPDALVSKVALILKKRPDGSWKRRFIIDLLRSGFNGGAVIPERIVLPRISDFIESIVDLLEYNSPAENARPGLNMELVTLDFKDAFYTLWLQADAVGSLTMAGRCSCACVLAWPVHLCAGVGSLLHCAC